MTFAPACRRPWSTLVGAALTTLAAWCAPTAAAGLPREVEAALQRAKLPSGALAVVVQEAGSGRELLAWNAGQPMNPASVFKLVTTYAALDQLGPAWTWTTPVYLSGPLSREGVLEGSVAIQGRGDPKLVVERVWLALRRLQQSGVREVRGDILLDHSFFAPPSRAPADFDNEPYKPQNVQPDALLLNLKSVTYGFVPDPAAGVARVGAEPSLAGVLVDQIVPLAEGACNDWRTGLKADLSDPLRVRFTGSYPSSCGERSWPMASADPQAYDARLVEQLWRELGGRLGGAVRDGPVPANARLAFELSSPPLAEVVRDINKYSNNVMAEQLFLSLASPSAAHVVVPPGPPLPAASAPLLDAPVPTGPAIHPEDARAALRAWLASRFGEAAAEATVIDNGSGLTREVRISAQLLVRLLQQAWDSGVMPELAASLPVTGTDGTMRRSTAAIGRAHLKTGSLRDVVALGGYVLSDNGRRYVLVALVNHPQAASARPALDALVQWVIRGPGRPPRD
jgi:D-alanyl-D-alanine carboxypeptidase/D-alanyl-D-alanine-endopeptidase (penicillin-binding protein 4)